MSRASLPSCLLALCLPCAHPEICGSSPCAADRSVVTVTTETFEGRQAGASDLFLKLPLGLTITAMGMPDFEKSDMGWDLTPTSMEVLLRAMWQRYRMPIIVTESGCADGEAPDTRRTRYLAAVLEVAHRLIAEGVDVRGYLIWTLLDNFEWAEGFEPRFGLLHTDFKTMARSERASSAMFKKLTAVDVPTRAPTSPKTQRRRKSKD